LAAPVRHYADKGSNFARAPTITPRAESQRDIIAVAPKQRTRRPFGSLSDKIVRGTRTMFTQAHPRVLISL